MGRLGFAAACAALAGLGACQGAHETGGAGGLCAPFSTATGVSVKSASAPAPGEAPATGAPIATGADLGAATDDCLHRWAYALAGSRDDARHVAEATVDACNPALGRWNQQTATGSGDGEPPIQAPSLITGQPTSPIAEHLSFAQGRALFYVVQARAGHCAPPPMTNGTPTGLTRD